MCLCCGCFRALLVDCVAMLMCFRRAVFIESMFVMFWSWPRCWIMVSSWCCVVLFRRRISLFEYRVPIYDSPSVAALIVLLRYRFIALLCCFLYDVSLFSFCGTAFFCDIDLLRCCGGAWILCFCCCYCLLVYCVAAILFYRVLD